MTKTPPKTRENHGLLRSAMSDSDCRALFERAHRRAFDAGQTIFVEGEPGSDVILIESGRVEVSISSLSGRKSVLAHMGPGEVLGEIAALDGGARSANAVAASAVSGLVLSRENVLTFVSERPEVARAIIAELCAKVRNASDMFSNQSVVEGGARLARALLRLFEKWGKPRSGYLVLSQPFSQTEIGEFSGLARENVNRYIKAWTGEGILTQIDGDLALKDRDRLADMADQ